MNTPRYILGLGKPLGRRFTGDFFDGNTGFTRGIGKP